MSNLQPVNNQGKSFAQRAEQIWLGMIKPHPSIKTIEEIHRAQMFSTLALIINFVILNALLFSPKSTNIFLVWAGISLASYILSRTKYYWLGTYFFSYASTAIGYITIFQGTASSINGAIATAVHVSLVISSVLLSQRGFLSLFILATIATFTAPLYSNSPVMEGESIRGTGGIILALGAILYGAQVYRANLEKARLKEVSDTNHELEDIKTNLEQRIGMRTLELKKANQQLEEAGQRVQEKAARLQVISEISQEISSNVDQGFQESINSITQIISNKLDYYHVGIFLLDENRQYAVLRAANSEGGQRMLERRHQLKVGGTGIVGYVSQSGRPRIALNTGSDAVFFNNPDLPQTHSEMAMPLKYGSQVIGVLDIQSDQPSAFKDEDAILLGTLANQIAFAINNVLGSEQAESDPQKRRRAGSQTFRRQKQSGYLFNADGTISAAPKVDSPMLRKALSSGETIVQNEVSSTNPVTLVVPVKFRDRVIGAIQIESAEKNRKWTEDEIMVVQSISERAAFALENARLFEETSRRAKQEQTIAQVTSQIGASTDFNRILQTTIEELGRTLGATRSFIQLSAPSENEDEYTDRQDMPVN